jgi:hypothetical protein
MIEKEEQGVGRMGNEANLSTEQRKAQENTRISCADGNSGRQKSS